MSRNKSGVYISDQTFGSYMLFYDGTCYHVRKKVMRTDGTGKMVEKEVTLYWVTTLSSAVDKIIAERLATEAPSSKKKGTDILQKMYVYSLKQWVSTHLRIRNDIYQSLGLFTDKMTNPAILATVPERFKAKIEEVKRSIKELEDDEDAFILSGVEDNEMSISDEDDDE